MNKRFIEQRESERRRLVIETDRESLQDLPAQTLDGHVLNLQANIEFPAEVDDAIRRGAEGIGLYRTEFLYLASDHEPSEEEHYGAYADALLPPARPATGDPHARSWS